MATRYLRTKIVVSLPIADHRDPREIAERTAELDKATAALKDALHASNVEVGRLQIVQTRAQNGAAGEPEPQAPAAEPVASPTPPPNEGTVADPLDIPPALRRVPVGA